MLLSSRVRDRIRLKFNVWFVSGYALVFILLPVIIVPHPFRTA